MPIVLALAVVTLFHDKVVSRVAYGIAHVLTLRSLHLPVDWVIIGPLAFTRRNGKRIVLAGQRFLSFVGGSDQLPTGTEAEQLAALRRYQRRMDFLIAGVILILAVPAFVGVASLVGTPLLLAPVAAWVACAVSTPPAVFAAYRYLATAEFDNFENARMLVEIIAIEQDLRNGQTYADIEPERIKQVVDIAWNRYNGSTGLVLAHFWAAENGDEKLASNWLKRAVMLAPEDDSWAYSNVMYCAATWAAKVERNPELARLYLSKAKVAPLELHDAAAISATINRSNGNLEEARNIARQAIEDWSPVVDDAKAQITRRYLESLVNSEPENTGPVESLTGFGIGEAQAGLRPRDWDLEPIERRINLADGSEDEGIGWLRKYWYLLDRGQFVEAESALETALALCQRRSPAAYTAARLEAGFFRAYVRGDELSASSYLKGLASRWSVAAHTDARARAAVHFAGGNLHDARKQAQRGLKAVENAADPGFAAFDAGFLNQIMTAINQPEDPETGATEPSVWGQTVDAAVQAAPTSVHAATSTPPDRAQAAPAVADARVRTEREPDAENILRPRLWASGFVEDHTAERPGRHPRDVSYGMVRAYYYWHDAGEPLRAETIIHRAVAYAQQHPMFDHRIVNAEMAYHLARQKDNPQAARAELNFETGDSHLRAVVRRAEAAILLAEGRLDDALTASREALALLAKSDPEIAILEREWIQAMIAEVYANLDQER